MEIGPVQLAVTRGVIKSLQLDRDARTGEALLSVECSGEILGALQIAEADSKGALLNAAHAGIAVATISCLAGAGAISEDISRKGLEVIGLAVPKLRADVNIPIEDVARFSQAELARLVEIEREVDRQAGFGRLGLLERATYNLESLKGWLAPDSWFGQYLIRTKKDFFVAKSPWWWLSESLGVYVSAYRYQVPKPKGPHVFYCRHTLDGFCNLREVLDSGTLEEFWDTGQNRWVVKAMAGLDRQKFAGKVSRSLGKRAFLTPD